MRLLHWFAALILAVELPVPIYWLVLHGGIAFWRKRNRGRLPYWVAVGTAWGLGGWLLYRFLLPEVFAATTRPATVGRPVWAILAGAVLLVADVAIFAIAESELGGRRLVGQAELSAKGELTVRGLYAHVRHPRYLGMMLGVLGVCVLAGSGRLWVVAAVWWLAALGIIHIEERELRERFGAAYAAHAERVPMLLPLRLGARRK
jgi:protein-S-isoprenylcysteine O-methyltransferase Ste14